MNYKLEYGRYGVKDWESDLVLPFEDNFETAKAMIVALSEVFKTEFDYTISDTVVNEIGYEQFGQATCK